MGILQWPMEQLEFSQHHTIHVSISIIAAVHGLYLRRTQVSQDDPLTSLKSIGTKQTQGQISYA